MKIRRNSRKEKKYIFMPLFIFFIFYLENVIVTDNSDLDTEGNSLAMSSAASEDCSVST